MFPEPPKAADGSRYRRTATVHGDDLQVGPMARPRNGLAAMLASDALSVLLVGGSSDQGGTVEVGWPCFGLTQGCQQSFCLPDILRQDLCPDDPLKTVPGQCGCNRPEVDSNGDGVCDADKGGSACPGVIVGGSCIFMLEQSSSWSAALASCAAEGAQLVSVFDRSTQTALETLMEPFAHSVGLWIGLNDRDQEVLRAVRGAVLSRCAGPLRVGQ